MKIFCLLFLCVPLCQATNWYVATNGNNSTGVGSQGNPWLTIQKATTAVTTIAGDVVRVQPGLYNETATINKSGSAGNFINIVADGAVACRGFLITSASYVNIIGFEIYHTNTTFNNGVFITGTGSNIGVIDNYVHNVHANNGGITIGSGTPNYTYVTYRGNTVEDMGYWNGVQNEFAGVAFALFKVTSEHCLIEYNTARRCGDYAYAAGAYNICRNNTWLDYEDRYTTNLAHLHVDGFQSGSDQQAQGTHDQIYENNWVQNTRNDNSHFGIWQNTTTALGSDDRNIVVRGNVGSYMGAGGIGVCATDEFKAYHNSFDNTGDAVPGNAPQYRYFTATDPCTNGAIVNCILSDTGNKQAINVTSQVNPRVDNNLGYLVSYDLARDGAFSFISTNNPLFVNPLTNGGSFRLMASSPALAVGTNMTTVSSANGSGTSFDVVDVMYFRDGYGIVTGDTITVSGNTSRTITTISGSTITVSSSVTWTNGAPVFWGTSTTPDLGAYPNTSTELSAAYLVQNGTTYTVVPVGDARGVWYYVDGIPTTYTETAPYTAVISSGTVTAKAYALYAQYTPVVTASPITSRASISVGTGGLNATRQRRPSP